MGVVRRSCCRCPLLPPPRCLLAAPAPLDPSCPALLACSFQHLLIPCLLRPHPVCPSLPARCPNTSAPPSMRAAPNTRYIPAPADIGLDGYWEKVGCYGLVWIVGFGAGTLASSAFYLSASQCPLFKTNISHPCTPLPASATCPALRHNYPSPRHPPQLSPPPPPTGTAPVLPGHAHR